MEDGMKVKEIMTGDVQACQLHTDLAAVAKLMWDHDCGFIPVVDDAGVVVGAVTDRDICIAAATRGLAPERIAVSEVMSMPVKACLPDDTTGGALSAMKQNKVRRLPVIGDDGRLKGVISLNDIIRATEARASAAKETKEIVAALPAICAPRRIVRPAAASR
jgi:CBS domain-containing protein